MNDTSPGKHVFMAKIYCGKLYLPSRLRRMMKVANGDVFRITVSKHEITMTKMYKPPELDGWIVRERKSKYADGFRYCSVCGLWFKPPEPKEFYRCPICNTSIRVKSKWKRRK